MAVNQKEALVVILDVGATMVAPRPDGKTFFEDAVHSIMFGLRDDVVSLVLCGTRETKNELFDGEHYKNVTVAHELSPPTVDTLRYATSLQAEAGGAPGDILDALVIGMDMLAKRTCGKTAYQRRVFLVTDAGCRTVTSDLDLITTRFVQMEAHLNVIGIGFGPEEKDESMAESEQESEAALARARSRARLAAASAVKRENIEMLRKVAKQVSGIIVPVSSAIEMMSYCRSKSVLQRTTCRAQFEVTPALRVNVYSYVKAKEQPFPQLKKVSTVAMQSPNPASLNVQQARSYQAALDPDTEVSASDVIHAYKYGKSLVPFSKADAEAVKIIGNRCFRLIGFTDSANVPRHHFMGNTEIVVAHPQDKAAQRALSALVAAMAETDSYAIARYVKTKNATPYLVALIPVVKHDIDCLYLQFLPFAEDLRLYTFQPFTPRDPETKPAFVPSADQLKAARAVIQALDLMGAAVDGDGERAEALKPKHTYNPVLQRFYQAVQVRALNSAAAVPELDPEVARYIMPDADLFARAETALRDFGAHFALEKTEAAAKSEKRVYWRDAMDDAARDVKLESYAGGEPEAKRRKVEGAAAEHEAAGLSLERLAASGVASVGSVNPARDFADMTARRDVDLVLDAVAQLQKRVDQLVAESLGEQYYGKALECLFALRKGCVREDEPAAFNTYLGELRHACEGKARAKFWNMVADAGLSLITRDESAYSSVSREQSEEYLRKPVEQAPAPVAPAVARSNTVDDLFDMAD
eukprot:m51a1_g919 putative atp-dependent dna helicase (755) ;mRNA; r:181520-185343